MPFYGRRVTYEDFAPHVKKLRDHLRRSTTCLCEDNEMDDNIVDCYLVDNNQIHFICQTYYKEWNALRSAKYLDFVPWGRVGGGVIYFYKEANGPVQTVSPTHIRLPKLSNLITLCPEDFFALLRIIAGAKNTPSKDSLSLNPAAVGIDDLSTSTLDPFFSKVRVNYRLNPEYTDKKWTDREVIAFLAKLDPTRDNQFSAMQYLTVMQNSDLLYFPVETAIDLELDWQQVSDDYVIPPNAQ